MPQRLPSGPRTPYPVDDPEKPGNEIIFTTGFPTASGRGKLHTFSIVYRPLKYPPLQAPYVLAMIELEEGPRLMSNLVGVEADPAKIRCDMPVVIEYADVTAEVTLPRFRPAS